MGQEIEFLTDVKYLIPGETVTVPIAINLEKRSKIKNITARFHAAERSEAQYTETSTDSDGDRKTETKTAVEYNHIVDEQFLLTGEEPMGCMASIGDFFASLIGAGKGEYLEAGRHEYSVTFKIPDDAPPSMDGQKCEIFYKLSARVNRPLAVDFREEKAFEVAPTIEMIQGEPAVAYYPDDTGRSFWDKAFGKDARLTLAVRSDVATPGDKIIALFQADTDSPIKIRSATARLVCVENTRADGHTDSHTHTSEPVTIATAQEIHGGFSTELIIDAESIGPMTTNAKNFTVRWFVEVVMDVPWATDPIIRTPIRLIGK